MNDNILPILDLKFKVIMEATGDIAEINYSVVKYHGRDMIMPSTSPFVTQAIQDLQSIITDLSKKKNDHNIDTLREEIVTYLNSMLLPEAKIKRYRLEILKEAIIPYLKKLKNRLSIDLDRFSQIQSLLRHLDNDPYIGEPSHPAEILLDIDKTISQINSKRGWWKSELAVSLQHAVTRQWQPILSDNRKYQDTFNSMYS